jgi:hypothetical protein
MMSKVTTYPYQFRLGDKKGVPHVSFVVIIIIIIIIIIIMVNIVVTTVIDVINIVFCYY